VTIALGLLVVAVVLFVWVCRALTEYSPRPRQAAELAVGATRATAPPDTLDVLTWNIGFAGLGREMDFAPDGGRRWRAESAARVSRNLEAITERLRSEHADVDLLQEVAEAGWLTRGVNLRTRLTSEADAGDVAFAPVIRVTFVPHAGRTVVGGAIRSRVGITQAVRHALLSKPAFPGVTLQHYHLLEARLPARPGNPGWVLFNVHLAAFDDGDLRRAQLAEVLRIAEAAYAEGHHVILGGDWNLRLVPTEFPASADPRHRFWVRDLPADATPPGWRWAVDSSAPTNRTLEAPYRAGVNYTSIIDGFLVSPNVEVLKVETRVLGFEHSDHQPVKLRVRARP
jgi:endonuclease/exonuclease/phosphatase family metal-dependent hydrolase